MQYPQFRRDGWPIGSGMVESANKNVVEARLKGTGMHWERTHVNPMLALRNAICNDRWREMWKTALKHHRKLQALQRSARAKNRAQAFLVVGDASSQESPPSPSAAASAHVSSPAPSQRVSEAGAPPVPPAPPVPEASQPSSCRLSSRRKRQTAWKRVKCSHQKSSEVNADVCPCGTPLVRFKGHWPKQYCSDRCRQHAHRKLHTQTKPFPGSSCAPTSKLRKRAVVLRVRVSSQRSGGVRGETCLFCGTRLVSSAGGRVREYCSDRCRQRAHRERQAQVS